MESILWHANGTKSYDRMSNISSSFRSCLKSDFKSVLRTLKSLFLFLFCFMQDITKCNHFATTCMK